MHRQSKPRQKSTDEHCAACQKGQTYWPCDVDGLCYCWDTSSPKIPPAPSTKLPFNTNTDPCDDILTLEVFEALAPEAQHPYSYRGFCQAVRDYNANHPSEGIFIMGTEVQQRHELAAFLGNVLHESDELKAGREYLMCADQKFVGGEMYCKPCDMSGFDWETFTCTGESLASEGRAFNGYCQSNLLPPDGCECDDVYEASVALTGHSQTFCQRPDWVATKEEYAWGAGLFYWMENVKNDKTCHQATLDIINGGLECPSDDHGWHGKAVQLRLNRYCRAATALGLDTLLSLDGCMDMDKKFVQCLKEGNCDACKYDSDVEEGGATGNGPPTKKPTKKNNTKRPTKRPTLQPVTPPPTIEPTNLISGPCTGEPCPVPPGIEEEFCRSATGICGTGPPYCNARSTWTSFCFDCDSDSPFGCPTFGCNDCSGETQQCVGNKNGINPIRDGECEPCGQGKRSIHVMWRGVKDAGVGTQDSRGGLEVVEISNQSSSVGEGVCGELIDKALFRLLAPNAQHPFTYEGFCSAIDHYNSRHAEKVFRMGTRQQRIGEITAFLGMASHDTDGFIAAREYLACGDNVVVDGELYCVPCTKRSKLHGILPTVHDSTEGCTCEYVKEVEASGQLEGHMKANDIFFGRGSIQISNNFNYIRASATMTGSKDTFCEEPELLSTVETFGSALNIINGSSECPVKEDEEWHSKAVRGRLDTTVMWLKLWEQLICSVLMSHSNAPPTDSTGAPPKVATNPPSSRPNTPPPSTSVPKTSPPSSPRTNLPTKKTSPDELGSMTNWAMTSLEYPPTKAPSFKPIPSTAPKPAALITAPKPTTQKDPVIESENNAEIKPTEIVPQQNDEQVVLASSMTKVDDKTFIFKPLDDTTYLELILTPTTGRNRIFYVQPTLNGWTENTVTYNSAPAASGTLFASAVDRTDSMHFELDVAKAVGNNVVSFRVIGTNKMGSEFGSKESSNRLNVPELVVTIVAEKTSSRPINNSDSSKENPYDLSQLYQGKPSVVQISGGKPGNSSPGRISGHVWLDKNSDGVKEADEPGLRGILVDLYSCDDRWVEGIRTSSGGDYIFDDLPEGKYYAVATAGADYGFTPKNVGPDDSKDSDVDATTGRSDCIDLSSPLQLSVSVDVGMVMSELNSAYTNSDIVEADDETESENYNCRGKPCTEGAGYCRSEHNYCGVGDTYCNEKSQWTSECPSAAPTSKPTVTPTTGQPSFAHDEDINCSGEPCTEGDGTWCRSEIGFCGSGKFYCNTDSIWLPKCGGTISTGNTQTLAEVLDSFNAMAENATIKPTKAPTEMTEFSTFALPTLSHVSNPKQVDTTMLGNMYGIETVHYDFQSDSPKSESQNVFVLNDNKGGIQSNQDEAWYARFVDEARRNSGTEETEPKRNGKESDAHGAEVFEAPSTMTFISNEPVASDEDESGGNEPENLATAALKNQEESFPQVLHDMLATPECQSIIHWLPDGLSFIIADKERFSSEILPKYFRGALLNSVIRKLNRWGFRRVKSRRKGEESSFAHSNFVRDKPWLCLRMKCKSKPTYHKVKVSSTSSKKKSKNKNKTKQSTSEVSNRNILANDALPAGIMSRTFVPTSTYSRVTTAAEHEPLPLPNHEHALLTVTAPAAAAGSLSAAVASTIQEMQYLASIPLYQQQRIFQERQILIAQMRQRHQVQMEAIVSSRNGSVQNAMMAQYARDMLNSRNIYYRG
ncbi:chitinase [Skeletonema marinoi]|uniref:Chitinase n=1 Tax=Skeletonema marinoi TaxID=267567 RepID=A0AAD8XUK7_9STRA|nr:chitinase [Skeletonema marinoi]